MTFSICRHIYSISLNFLSPSERITHIFKAFIKSIPIMGWGFAYLDKKIHEKHYIRHIKLENPDPYQRGLKHGQSLKNKIQVSTKALLLKFSKVDKDNITKTLDLAKKTITFLKDINKKLNGNENNNNVELEKDIQNSINDMNIFIDNLTKKIDEYKTSKFKNLSLEIKKLKNSITSKFELLKEKINDKTIEKFSIIHPVKDLKKTLSQIKDFKTIREEADQFEKQISENFKKELQGIAEGANVPYKDILFLHTFFDSSTSFGGCTAMGFFPNNNEQDRVVAGNISKLNILKIEDDIKNTEKNKQTENEKLNETKKKIEEETIKQKEIENEIKDFETLQKEIPPTTIANLISSKKQLLEMIKEILEHYKNDEKKSLKILSLLDNILNILTSTLTSLKKDESFKNIQSLKNAKILKNEEEKSLKLAERNETVQSIVFNPNNFSLKIASNGKKASSAKFQNFSFSEKEKIDEQQSFLLKNFDFSWYLLGQNTVIFEKIINKKKIITVGFPGYAGTHAGMNEDGLSIAACSGEELETNTKGIPNPILFSEMLNTCKNASEALKYLENNEKGSSMNLILMDPKKALNIEITNNECHIVEEVEIS